MDLLTSGSCVVNAMRVDERADCGRMERSVTLRGERCMLRRWRMTDAVSLVHHADNLSVARHLRDRFPHPYTPRDAQAFLTAASAEEPQTNFAIEIDGEATGGLGYVQGSDVERYSAEVGYWLGEACWGRGVVTEALALFTRHALKELGFLRLFALPLADNTASIRVLEKAGYSREGVLRSSCVKFGQPRDQAIYAIVNDRWSVDGR
jgi:RimJ/RimL family protein N-acetyltransferase